MTAARLELDRSQILAFRLGANGLDGRSQHDSRSLRRAAWIGLQDSMPRAAVLSIHARVVGTSPEAWSNPAFVQIWGPRFSAYVVPEPDRALFTLGRLSDDPRKRHGAQQLADRLDDFLAGREMSYAEAGRALGVDPNQLRYAAPTGRVLIRWDGARRPTVRTVPAPEIDPEEAHVELARRHLHVFGPGTPTSFSNWAGITLRRTQQTFEALDGELTPVATPIGDAWILASDEAAFRADADNPGEVRLLPSGDALFLLQGREREILVPEPERRADLWPSRVWPGAILIDGSIAGTWRRTKGNITATAWHRLSEEDRVRVEAEAATLPLPANDAPPTLQWGGS